jgi:hypothetical protein
VYSFSKRSRTRLDSCHPKLIELVEEMLKWVDVTVICGHRGRKAQMIAVQENKSDAPWPQSKHNKKPSLACDIAIYPIDWGSKRSFFLLANLMLAEAFKRGINLRWGGAWREYPNTPKMRMDLGHYEIRGLDK